MLSILRVALLIILTPLALAECLKKDEAERILNRYVSLFQKITPKAVANTVAPSMDYYSDCLDFLYGSPLPGSLSGEPFWRNRDEFVQGQEYAQEERKRTSKNFKFRVLQWRYSCDSITFHWRGDGVSRGNLPGSTNQAGDAVGISGVDFLILNTKTSPKLIKTVYSEFSLGEVLYTSGQKICFQKDNDEACTCPSTSKRLFKK